MFKQSDLFILLAVMISFVVSGVLWFSGSTRRGAFHRRMGPFYFVLRDLL